MCIRANSRTRSVAPPEPTSLVRRSGFASGSPGPRRPTHHTPTPPTTTSSTTAAEPSTRSDFCSRRRPVAHPIPAPSRRSLPQTRSQSRRPARISVPGGAALPCRRRASRRRTSGRLREGLRGRPPSRPGELQPQEKLARLRRCTAEKNWCVTTATAAVTELLAGGDGGVTSADAESL